MRVRYKQPNPALDPKPDPIRQAAGNIGKAIQSGGDVDSARQAWRAVKLERHIIEIMPTLTVKQQRRLARILRETVAGAAVRDLAS